MPAGLLTTGPQRRGYTRCCAREGAACGFALPGISRHHGKRTAATSKHQQPPGPGEHGPIVDGGACLPRRGGGRAGERHVALRDGALECSLAVLSPSLRLPVGVGELVGAVLVAHTTLAEVQPLSSRCVLRPPEPRSEMAGWPRCRNPSHLPLRPPPPPAPPSPALHYCCPTKRLHHFLLSLAPSVPMAVPPPLPPHTQHRAVQRVCQRPTWPAPGTSKPPRSQQRRGQRQERAWRQGRSR